MRRVNWCLVTLGLVFGTACGDDDSGPGDGASDTGDASEVTDVADDAASPDESADVVEDAPEDVPADEATDVPADVVEDVSEEVEDAPEETADVPADVEDVPEEVEDVPADVPDPICGNGDPESGEVCDDDDEENEACGTTVPGACLADCSLDQSQCGDGAADPGEACDDGDDDNMNGCTTSCTVNDHNIGAPCTCTGGSCSSRDFTVGTINGCVGVTPPAGSGGVVACMRSITDSGTSTYYAEGYCTLIAVTCSGSLCFMVPQPGNYATFACPEDYFMLQDSREVAGMTITSRSCARICDSQADCRWNAYDTFHSTCGQYQCMPEPGGSGTTICADPQQY